MRYASIRKIDISNGDGVGVALFVQGCNIHCKGCFNPETWDFNRGKPFTQETKDLILELMNKDYITRFSILGGEPLDRKNVAEVAAIINLVRKKYPDKKIYLWTGYSLKNIKKRIEDNKDESGRLRFILDNLDYIITEPFIEELKDITLKMRGSSNQEVHNFKRGEKCQI